MKRATRTFRHPPSDCTGGLLDAPGSRVSAAPWENVGALALCELEKQIAHLHEASEVQMSFIAFGSVWVGGGVLTGLCESTRLWQSSPRLDAGRPRQRTVFTCALSRSLLIRNLGNCALPLRRKSFI